MNVIELTNEEYNAIMESREVLDEFNSDIKAAYADRRRAEKLSGHHDSDKTELVKNKKGNYYHSTTPGKDAKDWADKINHGIHTSKKDNYAMTYTDKYNPDNGVKTLKDKIDHDKVVKSHTNYTNSKINQQERSRKFNKIKDKLGMKVKESSRDKQTSKGNIVNDK